MAITVGSSGFGVAAGVELLLRWRAKQAAICEGQVGGDNMRKKKKARATR
jgi:hypothetical protein